MPTIEAPCSELQGKWVPPRRVGTPSESRRIFDLKRTLTFLDALANPAASCGVSERCFGSNGFDQERKLKGVLVISQS